MIRLTLLAFVTTSLLSACAGQVGGPPPQPGMSKAYSNSIGFTGLSGDFGELTEEPN